MSERSARMRVLSVVARASSTGFFGWPTWPKRGSARPPLSRCSPPGHVPAPTGRQFDAGQRRSPAAVGGSARACLRRQVQPYGRSGSRSPGTPASSPKRWKGLRVSLSGARPNLTRCVSGLLEVLVHVVRCRRPRHRMPQERLRAEKRRRADRCGGDVRGHRVRLTVSDDGRGVDLEEVVANAVARQILAPDEAEQLDQARRSAAVPARVSTNPADERLGPGIGPRRRRRRRAGSRRRPGIDSKLGPGTSVTVEVPVARRANR